ncbi:MAG: FKBP-type peptidyl-prolyl cis-trans isomerase [Bacteroidales bacterium]
MKAFQSILFVMIVGVMIVSCSQNSSNSNSSSGPVTLNNDLDSVSYAMGLDIGNNLKNNGFESVNIPAITKGFEDAFDEGEDMIPYEEAGNYIRNYFTMKQKREADANLKAAEEFLAENKKNEGVNETESGLQYEIIRQGDGPIPTKDDMVSVYYKGTRIDGTVFDETTEGNPAKFRVTGVIKGWTEALTMMPVGSKWKLYIHPDLAYGAQARGNIKANDLLIFEIELLEIVK